MRLQEMGNGKTGTQGCSMAAIKCKQLVGRPVAQQMTHAPSDIPPCPCRPESIALQIEKCDLIERVNDPKAGIELKAVDDPDFVIEPDVFGTQVAVSIHDTTMT